MKCAKVKDNGLTSEISRRIAISWFHRHSHGSISSAISAQNTQFNNLSVHKMGTKPRTKFSQKTPSEAHEILKNFVPWFSDDILVLDNNNFTTINTAFVFIYKNKNTLLRTQSSVTKEKVIRAFTG